MSEFKKLEKILRQLIKEFEGTSEELNLQAAVNRTEQLLKELLGLECRQTHHDLSKIKD